MFHRFLTVAFLLISGASFAQFNKFSHKRQLTGINDQWHKVQLPTDMFEKVRNDFTDIRIYGVTSEFDTIEVPFLKRTSEGNNERKVIDFSLLNISKNENGFYFTFEINQSLAIDEIHLDFEQENFDWNIALEGSNEQTEWFTILDNYRLVSIRNENTNYSYETLHFSESNFKYYRVQVKSETEPKLAKASILKNERVDSEYENYDIKNWKEVENQDSKTSVVSVKFKSAVALSSLALDVEDNIDYYRRISISYLADSIKTEKGWIYEYLDLCYGTISSLEKGEFHFSSTIAKELKIIILNNDNEALRISSIEAKGFKHQLVARFTKPADYFLVYGNERMGLPNYDIANFEHTIPANLRLVKMGKEEQIAKKDKTEKEPIFNNEWWLWLVMSVIIVLLGGFSFSMLKKSK